MKHRTEPQSLGSAITELIARRGLAQSSGQAELTKAWQEAAGDQVAGNTRVLAMRNGVVEIGVRHAALLSRLTSFEKPLLLQRMQEHQASIKDLKFRLKGDIAVTK